MLCSIQTIALLLSEPRRKPSLVVAPVVALMQWKHEIETHAEGFTVCLWHGSGRMKASELKKYDVVSHLLSPGKRSEKRERLIGTRSSAHMELSRPPSVDNREVSRGAMYSLRKLLRSIRSNGTGKSLLSCPTFLGERWLTGSRIILDEAHNIKERSANVAKAAFSLDAQYKWCLSGTPLQNRVGELYSLVRFLGADPFR